MLAVFQRLLLQRPLRASDDSLVFAVVSVVDEALVLAEAPVGAYAVRLGRVLDDDLVVDALIARSNDRRVVDEQPRVDPNFGYVERVGAGEETEAVDVPSESAERAEKDVRAVADLGARERVHADEQARLADKLGDTNDLPCDEGG